MNNTCENYLNFVLISETQTINTKVNDEKLKLGINYSTTQMEGVVHTLRQTRHRRFM